MKAVLHCHAVRITHLLLLLLVLCAVSDHALAARPILPWLAVAPDTIDNLALLKIEAPIEASADARWEVLLRRIRAPDWVTAGKPSIKSGTLSLATPLEFALPFAVGTVDFDTEGEIAVDFEISNERGETFQHAARVPLWVREPATLEAQFEPASRDKPALLTLLIKADETVWNAGSLEAGIGALRLSPTVTISDEGRTINAEHRFVTQTPGPGRHTVSVRLADQLKGRVRELVADFDYLASLAIAGHELRPLDEPQGAPWQHKLSGGEQALLSLEVETFEPQPLLDLELTPRAMPPLKLGEGTAPQLLARLVRGKPQLLEALVVEAAQVSQRTQAEIGLETAAGGKPQVLRPALPLAVEPGESLVVVIDGLVDDARREGLPNNADGLAQPGETVRIPLRVLNRSELTQPSYTLTVRSEDESLVILDNAPQSGRPLVPGDSQEHWVGARVAKDAKGHELTFEAKLDIETRPDPLHFTLQLELPALGPLAALRLPVLVAAFADEDTRIRASLPPRLMPDNPIFVWEFSDTTEVWRTHELQLIRRFGAADSGMLRVLLYDGDSGALVGAGGGMVVVFGLTGEMRERAANRKSVKGMAAMLEGQMAAGLAQVPGATLDEKYQAMAASQAGATRQTEAQRLAMLEQFAAMYGGTVDVERVRQGFERLLRDPPPMLPGHEQLAR
jgi:hypothetical protein